MSIKPNLKAGVAMLAASLTFAAISADKTVTDTEDISSNIDGTLIVSNGNATVTGNGNINASRYYINSGSIVVNDGTTLTVPSDNYTINVIGKGNGNCGVLTVNGTGTLVDTKNGNSYNGDTANNNSSYMLAGYDGANATVNIYGTVNLDWKYLYAACKNNGQQIHTEVNVNGGKFTVGEIHMADEYESSSNDSNPLLWPETVTINLSNDGELSIRSIHGSGRKALAKINFAGGKLSSRWGGQLVGNQAAVVMNFEPGTTSEMNIGHDLSFATDGKCFLSGSGAIKKTSNGTLRIGSCDASDFTGDIYISQGTLNFPIVANGVARKVYFDGGTLSVPNGGCFASIRNGGSIEFISQNGNPIRLSCDGTATIDPGVVFSGHYEITSGTVNVAWGETSPVIWGNGASLSGDSFVKLGSGIAYAGGAGNHTGATIVEEGTLVVSDVATPKYFRFTFKCYNNDGWAQFSRLALYDATGAVWSYGLSNAGVGRSASELNAGTFSCSSSRGNDAISPNEGQGIDNIFMDNDDKWCGYSNNGVSWTEYTVNMRLADNANRIVAYNIMSGNDDSTHPARSLSSFKLQSSVDGVNWDSVQETTPPHVGKNLSWYSLSPYPVKPIRVDAPKYFRITLKNTHSGTDATQVSKLALYDSNGKNWCSLTRAENYKPAYALAAGTFSCEQEMPQSWSDAEMIEKMFDDNVGTKWCIWPQEVNEWRMVMRLPDNANRIVAYNLFTGSDDHDHNARSVSDARLESSADGRDWKVVSETTNIAPIGKSKVQYFPDDKPIGTAAIVSPKYFRITLKNTHGTTTQISQIKLCDNEGTNWAILEKADNYKPAYTLDAGKFSCEQEMPKAWSENELVEKMFDGNVDTKWCMNTDTSIDYRIVMRLADNANRIVSYNLFTGGDDSSYNYRSISDIKLESSVNGKDWRIVSEQANLAEIGRNKAAYFSENKPILTTMSMSPKFFRFSFQNTYDSNTQFAWLKLCAADGTIQSTGITDCGEVGRDAKNLAPGTYSRVTSFGDWGSNQNIEKIFDNSDDTKYGGSINKTLCQVVFRLRDDADHIAYYDVMSGNDDETWHGRRLTNFKLESSVDGETWQTVSDVTVTDRTEKNKAWYSGGTGYYLPYPFEKTSHSTAATIPAASAVEVNPGARLAVETAMTISKLRINLDDEKAVVSDGNATPGKIEGFTPAQNGILELTCNDAEIQSKIAAHQDIAIGLDFESVSGTANDSLRSWSCTLNGQKTHYRLEISEGARNSKLKFCGGVFFMVY